MGTKKKNDDKLKTDYEKDGWGMKRNNKYKFKSPKKRTGKIVTIILLISGIIMTGLVTWVGINDWDVEKSYKEIGTAVGIPKEENGGQLELNEGSEVDEEPESQNPTEADKDTKQDALPTEDRTKYIERQKLPSKPTFIQGVLIANKQHPLPENFKPEESIEARLAFDEMAAEALLDDFNLYAFSTYRSFDRQVELYARYVEQDGEEAADRYSARPGYSEHQTGLAFDIGEVNREKDWASSRFGNTEAGKWLASNAHRFGYIMRYPEGKEKVTGYMHESWHFRYVGPEIAEKIYEANSTLEEYLGL